jgi:hypothetical protein
MLGAGSWGVCEAARIMHRYENYFRLCDIVATCTAKLDTWPKNRLPVGFVG